MSETFYPNDEHCLSLFPELLQLFSEDDLRAASTTGTYIFHEDYFARFIENQARDELMLRRIAKYVELLASSHDVSLRNLAAVGILEGLVSKQNHSIAPYIGPATGELLAEVLPRFAVDPNPWRRRGRR
jgi:hypothetical protein